VNPEFRRNLWLEFSGARLVGMPLVLGLVFAAIYIARDEPGQGFNMMVLLAKPMFLVLAILWGTRLAAGAVAVPQRRATPRDRPVSRQPRVQGAARPRLPALQLQELHGAVRDRRSGAGGRVHGA